MTAKVILLLFVWSVSFSLFSQEPQPANILFYNVENLFDPADDPDKKDDDFTPGGNLRWSHGRKEQKLNHISRVLLYAGGWNPPVLVGFCEVEHLNVLKSLVWNTGLNHLHYHIIHYPSPDERGIDVALLYQNNRFKMLSSRAVEVQFRAGERPSRDILYVSGLLDNTDTLHVVVNHWPSRYGGAVATIPKRLAASEVLVGLCDSILNLHPHAKIVAMGDFNDGPNDESLLNVTRPRRGVVPELFNLALQPEGEVPGTIKYRNVWSLFDQMIVSNALLSDSTNLHVEPPRMKIVAPDFLLEEDPDYPGVRPWRTYRGFKYTGGYSDHLPVMITLTRQNAISGN